MAYRYWRRLCFGDFTLSRKFGANTVYIRDQVLLLGQSQAIRTLHSEIDKAASSHAKVLILGETGVGKEVVARLIHRGGRRRDRPFVAVNCSGIPETLLESELFGHVRGSFTGAYRDKPGLVRLADQGTLFLDELGEMSLRMQAVLLRFAETGEMQAVGSETRTDRTDVRLITATNRDLRAQIDADVFRRDLYYRLNVIEIWVPPLRERGDDVALLLRHFLKEASRQHEVPCPELTRAAEELLLRHTWPGNVRELKNIAERLAVQHERGPITPEALPRELRAFDSPAPVAQADRSPVEAVKGPAMATIGSPQLEQAWARLKAGEDFWSAVHVFFKSHDLTRADVREVVRRGLMETHGSYRQLVTFFHMPRTDYKRFLSFLSQHQCNVSYKPFRDDVAARDQRSCGVAS
jgi:DNA-binding NtrC family response regulator